jgi:hypothetical protein
LPTERSDLLAIPLARWFDRQLQTLSAVTGSPAIAAMSGATIMAERVAPRGFPVPGRVAAGGKSKLLQARDGWIALTLSRDIDYELLPALFGDADFPVEDEAAIAAAVSERDWRDLLALGRDLGLALAGIDEVPASPSSEVLARGARSDRPANHQPLVLDLSSLWAGPLAGHFFHLAGARVVKVESKTRADRMREYDPHFFGLLNQGKASVEMDFTDPAQIAELIALIRRADIVIEAARVRGLLQLGIDANALVREVPGLVWLTVTGHGATGEAANWVGIGHDCGVAGGLSRAILDVTGDVGYVGDAIADPLTGILAALDGWQAYQSGEAQRIGFALSACVARALAEERAFDTAALDDELRAWRAAEDEPFPHSRPREVLEELRPLGADNAGWLGAAAPC